LDVEERSELKAQSQSQHYNVEVLSKFE